jgi:hypothetical protein
MPTGQSRQDYPVERKQRRQLHVQRLVPFGTNRFVDRDPHFCIRDPRL